MLTLRNSFLPTRKSNDSELSTKDYIDRLWEHTIDDFFTTFNKPWNDLLETSKNEDGTISIYIDVPGVKEQDISIELKNNLIHIKAERKNRNSSWSIDKSFTIPKEYTSDNLRAELIDGVLTLILSPNQNISEDIKKIEIVKK